MNAQPRSVKSGPLAVSALLSALCCGAAAGEQPSEGSEAPPGLVEEVVTIGTRHAPRSAIDSVVPVDVFDAEDMASVQSSDLLDVVGTIVPSFYVARYPIADGASFMRPTNLRGLDSHHALVLVDGKRRHRGAVLRLGSFGPHGVDIGGLPSIAFGGVEVLRDGAAAQYGSDAIAGVLDFKLRESASGFDVRVRRGGYSAGDGEETTVEATGGLPLGRGGFLTLSAQVAAAEATSRSEPYDLPIGGSGLTPLASTRNRLTVDGTTYYGPDALTYVYDASGNAVQILPGSDGVPDDLDTRFADNYANVGGSSPFASPVQIWGQPRRRQAMLVANAGKPLGERAELYGFASYSRKDQRSGFFYRRPGVSQLLPVRLASGAIYDPRARLYPAGFTPQFRGEVHDYAMHTGVRGDSARGLGYDFSATYGRSRIRYHLENTLNPSLGPETPTRFRPGNLVNDELALNADFTRPLAIGERLLNFAFGAEYRNEGYAVEEGDPASYAIGPFGRRDPFNLEITQAEVDASADDALVALECRIPGFRAVGSLCPEGDPVNNALPIGSNGFPGYPPAFASDVGRQSYAAYVDLETELTPRLLGNAALRVEHFEDFGNVAIWKLAGRFRLTESLNLRASLGTGFRAPTPGQMSTTNVSTRIGGDGTPRAEGLFPATHPAAALFGALPLEAETSRSVTAGVALDLPFAWPATLTVDCYRIDLDDRITLSSQFPVGAAEAAELVALGVPGANDIAQVRFFVNDVRTRTQGVDVVANWQLGGALDGASVEAAVNFNRTRMLDRGRFLFDESQYDIENGLPAMRGTLTARHAWRSFDGMLRLRWFGKHSNAQTSRLERIQHFGREAVLDAQAGWTWREAFRVQVGAENLLDAYPDEAAYETCCGMVYRRDSIMPWQGRMVYVQVQAWR